MRTLIKNATVALPDQLARVSVIIEGEKIVDIDAAIHLTVDETVDADGLHCYLESSNPRNISLYERHGFEIMGRIEIGAGPPVTPMLSRPR